MRVRAIHGIILSGLAVVCLLVAGLIIIPAVSPATGAQVADLLRTVIGVQPVSQIESISDSLRDDINRYRFSSSTPQPQIALSNQNPADAQGPIRRSAAAPHPTVKGGPLAPATTALTADPQLGWQAFGSAPAGDPLMARTLVLIDPSRSYAGVALVRIDLSKAQLHMMPGIIEPAHPSGIGQMIPDLGTVPPADRGALVAAFNGGFKGVHGHFGMMVDGLTLLKPIDGMATVAIYKDGSVQMGAWNQDISPSADMVALRQNCPPLIDGGNLNPALSTDARKAWGFTNNSDITWRTALGITQDRRFLIYAVGNGTDVRFLAEALLKAGAYEAMQLDINQYYAQFMAYSQVNGQPVGEHLVDQMENRPQQFLTPAVRDFFYVTVR